MYILPKTVIALSDFYKKYYCRKTVVAQKTEYTPLPVHTLPDALKSSEAVFRLFYHVHEHLYYQEGFRPDVFLQYFDGITGSFSHDLILMLNIAFCRDVLQSSRILKEKYDNGKDSVVEALVNENILKEIAKFESENCTL